MPRPARFLVAFAVLQALAAAPATADDRSTCNDATGEAALAACDRAIASGAFTGGELAKLHTNRGVERKRAGDLDGAIADYTMAIGLNPADLFGYNNRANARRDKGDVDGAIADYTEALKIDPGYTQAYVNRGLVYERLKDLDRARDDYRQAIARPPKYNNGPGAQSMARSRLSALSR